MTDESHDWSDWLAEHGPALVLYARQWTGNRADAEDIAQEAFVRFWRSRHSAKDPIAYLYACVRRYALEWLRGRGRRARREEAAARADFLDESLFTGPLEQEERREAIEAALQQLPDPQREVLVLKIWAGLSFQQICESVEIPLNTAASRYRYALARLRELLGDWANLAKEPIP
jgi:RNA polymerase sigma-70 factor (ECF subfamily)